MTIKFANLTIPPGSLLQFCTEHARDLGISVDGPPIESGNRQDFSSMVFEFAVILYILVFLIGIFGNSLVIYVVMRYSKMQTVTNMYILNLAIADEMFLVCLVFLITTMLHKSWMFGRILCKIYMTITSINQFTSSLLLAVMSADRYIAVCHPITAPKYRTPFIAKFICLTVWTIAAILMVPIFMYSDTYEKPSPGTGMTCNIIWPESEWIKGEKMRGFTLYSFTLGFFLPCIAIFLFYILVLCRLRRVGPKNKSKEKRRSHRKVTYLVLTVIAIYVLCWLPYWLGQLYITFIPDFYFGPQAIFLFSLLASCLSYVNSAVNPILYAFLSENFKKSFAKAFQCAAKKDVNAQLALENSVFPRPNTLGKTSLTGNKSGSHRRNLGENTKTEDNTMPLVIGNEDRSVLDHSPIDCEDSIERNSNFGPSDKVNEQFETFSNLLTSKV